MRNINDLVNWHPSGSVFINQVSPRRTKSHGVNAFLIGRELPFQCSEVVLVVRIGSLQHANPHQGLNAVRNDI